MREKGTRKETVRRETVFHTASSFVLIFGSSPAGRRVVYPRLESRSRARASGRFREDTAHLPTTHPLFPPNFTPRARTDCRAKRRADVCVERCRGRCDYRSALSKKVIAVHYLAAYDRSRPPRDYSVIGNCILWISRSGVSVLRPDFHSSGVIFRPKRARLRSKE